MAGDYLYVAGHCGFLPGTSNIAEGGNAEGGNAEGGELSRSRRPINRYQEPVC
jgi:hypothetical protein